MKLFLAFGIVLCTAIAVPVAIIGVGLTATATPPTPAGSASAVDGWALPLPAEHLSLAKFNRPHHSYPALDISVPQHTPLYAITNGTITLAHPNRNRCGGTIILTTGNQHWTYCHLATITVRNGQHVTAGTPLGTSGGQPGTPGAGRSTGPHLHLSLHINDTLHCPQPILTAIWNQQRTPTNPPRTGCISGTL